MKKIIIALLAVSLMLSIFFPNIINPGLSNAPFAFIYYVYATISLFWLGLSKGWNFANDNGFTGLMALLCPLIGMYLSLPIAIIQLFTTD